MKIKLISYGSEGTTSFVIDVSKLKPSTRRKLGKILEELDLDG